MVREMNEKYRYKFSVIMPLYNVEEFFEEAIESVIHQTIGFEENIQVILVNDESPDNIEELCMKYTERYPANISYVKKENGGVSSARNEGMKYIKGKYVNFFDPDDRWDESAFAKAFTFLEKHEDVDVVSCRHCFFGRREGFLHPLDYKYHEEQVIDINKDFSYIQMAVNDVFIRSNALDGVQFDIRLRIAEDTVFMTKIILDKCKYGILPDAVYYYRKRESNNSAIDQSQKSRTWYFDTPQIAHNEIIECSKEKRGKVIPYVQYIVMYEIQWRLKAQLPDDFTIDERNQYVDIIKHLLMEIDDSIILMQKNIGFEYKIFALSLKYGYDIMKDIYLDKWIVKYNELRLFSLRAKSRLHISNLKIRNNKLYIEGRTTLGILGNGYQIEIIDSKGEHYNPVLYKVLQRDKYAFTGEKILEGNGFRSEIPLKGLKWIRFELTSRDGDKVVLAPSFGRYAKIDETQKDSYYYHKGHILKYENKKIKRFPGNKRQLINAEIKYLKNEVLKKHRIKCAFYRIIYFILRLFKKTDIWIVSDRTNVAGDNGEALFSFLMEQNNRKADVYFAIDKNSRDYKKLKSIGNVIKMKSIRYKIKFLLSDKIVSSHADGWVNNAYGSDRDFVKNLYDFDYVFLQHGITKDDLSDWLHKYKKDISLFITSSKEEYDSIIKGDYGYTDREVKMTGLPRYDKLVSMSENKIVFLPTWRKSLSVPALNGSSVRPYSYKVKESQYCKFYNDLINDKRLLEVMRKNSYVGEFYLHPALFNNASDFCGNDYITVIDETADYNKVFKENALLITDYSSVAFDFAYMKKPVVYTQFDYDTILNEHIYGEGYFSYEENGFGHVCYTYEDAVDTIINCIEHGCVMEQKYVDRVDSFFAWNDRNNCERVYNEILKL